MWELECINGFTTYQILISAYSTAMFMPKILKDSEPVLILCIKCYFQKGAEQFKRNGTVYFRLCKSI